MSPFFSRFDHGDGPYFSDREEEEEEEDEEPDQDPERVVRGMLLMVDRTETEYMTPLDIFELLDNDNTGYSDDIEPYLEFVSRRLVTFRRHNCLREFETRFELRLPELNRDEIDESLRVMAGESPEVHMLLFANQIQIRSASDLDVALHVTKFYRLHQPIFLLPSMRVFDILNARSQGRFRCRIKAGGVWSEAFEGGRYAEDDAGGSAGPVHGGGNAAAGDGDS